MNRKERRLLKRQGKFVIKEPVYAMKPSQMVKNTMNGAKDQVNHAINQQILDRDKQYAIDVDTMYLWTLHIKYGWGYERLKRFYLDVFKEHLRMREFYEIDDLYPEKAKLKEKTGVDMDAWFEALFDDEGNFKNVEEVELP